MLGPHDPWVDSAGDAFEVAPLNSQQAQALQARLGALCLSCALWLQLLLAACLLLVLYLANFDSVVCYSALAGVLLAWLPQAALVWGVGRKIGQGNAAAWLLRLFCWEAVKWVLTLALMALVAIWIRDVSWLALLLAFIFTLKAGWGVLFVQHLRRASRSASFQGELNE